MPCDFKQNVHMGHMGACTSTSSLRRIPCRHPYTVEMIICSNAFSKYTIVLASIQRDMARCVSQSSDNVSAPVMVEAAPVRKPWHPEMVLQLGLYGTDCMVKASILE